MCVCSAEPYIQKDCSQVYIAAILLCAALLLTTQREAGRIKAVFKDFWRTHINLIYLSAFPLTCIEEDFLPYFYVPRNCILVVLSYGSIPPDSW